MDKQQRIEWTSRAFLRGLAIGALVLTLFGAAWAVAPAGAVGSTPLTHALAYAAIGLVAIGLVLGCASLFRLAQRLLVDTSPEGVARGRAVGKRLGIGFGIVFGSEAAIIALSASLLSANQLDDYILPVIVLIIGLHFIPLAWLFQVWPYYVTGVLISLIAIVTLLAIPRTAALNYVSLWVLVPATGSALVLWLTALTVLLLGRQTVRASTRGSA
jgi:hypothetical protein